MREVINIARETRIIPTQPVITSQPYISSLYAPDIFSSGDEENEYLASLDSDTREYVLRHSGEFSSKEDIFDCVNRMHGTS